MSNKILFKFVILILIRIEILILSNYYKNWEPKMKILNIVIETLAICEPC